NLSDLAQLVRGGEEIGVLGHDAGTRYHVPDPDRNPVHRGRARNFDRYGEYAQAGLGVWTARRVARFLAGDFGARAPDGRAVARMSEWGDYPSVPPGEPPTAIHPYHGSNRRPHVRETIELQGSARGDQIRTRFPVFGCTCA